MASTEAAPTQAPYEDADNQELEADNDVDSTYEESVNSETTSVASIYKGYSENGRVYQSVRDEHYFMPTDDKQWESMSEGHLMWLIMDSQRANVLFQSPISPKAQHIMDLGTGTGEWALNVADKYPNLTVHAVDLHPAPNPWTAPNCVFEIDDISRPWTWSHKFDLVHIRNLIGSFSDPDWRTVYKHIYDNLEPGGWIEQLESDLDNYCDDNTLPANSILRFKDMFYEVSNAAGRGFDTQGHMEARIKEAGFINIKTQQYKVPLGPWPKLQVYKDAGSVNLKQYLTGIEGWVMYLLTKHGLPKPWAPEEVQVWLAKVRRELSAGYHIYHKYTRVWAQKPYATEQK